ncbi:MAG: DUF6975 family protein [Sphingomonadaceae bacterium]
MSNIAPKLTEGVGIAATLATLIGAEGTGAHRFSDSVDLNRGKFATRNLADMAHYLCTLHGRHPGVIDLAATHTVQDGARTWLLKAVDGFAIERGFLTKLVVAAGPLPSTPGQADSEAAVNGQRHALDMLARSDRNGCALGAAMTLVIDWHEIRIILDHAGKRWGVETPDCALPSMADTLSVATACAESAAIERAMNFGAQQILAQHRGLWNLLEARHIARGEY